MQTILPCNSDSAQRVPMELVTDILEYLPQPDLCAAASASRSFYRAAQVGRCIRRTIDLSFLKEGQLALSIFKLVVQHVLGKPPCDRPGIALRLVCAGPSDRGSEFARAFGEVLDCINGALPFLVGLEAYLPPMLCTALYGVLRDPAPRLRYLALGHGDSREGRPVAPPQDLFNGSARRLRSLCLVLPVWEPQWVPVRAFHRVTNARVVLYNSSPPLVISRFLPGLRSLAVQMRCQQLQRDQVLDLSGVDLHDLALAEGRFARISITGVDLRRVPVVERVSGTLFDDGIWSKDDSAPLCARFTPVRPWAADTSFLSAVSPASGDWTRVAFPNRKPSPILAPLDTIPRMETRLVALMLDHTLLAVFLQCRSTLSALTDLYVDFSLPQPLECRPCDLSGLGVGDVQLDCPRLRSVASVSFLRRMELRAENVAILGRMLKQHRRSDEVRSALNMAGLGFV